MSTIVVPQQERALPDLAITVADRPVAPNQYSYIETHAWWLGSFGIHQHLTEHRLRQWVPARPDREWVLERELTGAQRWLAGSEVVARSEGFDLRAVSPVGRFSAYFGEFTTDDMSCGDDGSGHDDGGHDHDHLPGDRCPARPAPPAPRTRGTWQMPTLQFFATLPRDPLSLLDRLRGENTGRWFGPFAAAVTALRTALVPADLRAVFFKALLKLPGVHVAESAANIDGTPCVAIVHDVGRTTTELLIDPSDGQFAGERDTLRDASRAGLPCGTVISATAVRTAVVDTVGARPTVWHD